MEKGSGTNLEKTFQGTPVSPGIVFAEIQVVARGFSPPKLYPIGPQQVEREKQRFKQALQTTKKQLENLRTRVGEISGDDEALIFDAHLMILEDSAVFDRVQRAIEERRQNAEYCFYAVMQNNLEALRRVADPYLRERTSDIEDICTRVLRNFNTHRSTAEPEPDQRQDHILVTYDLSPSETVSIDREKVLGFATEIGSANSHTSILARSMNIPAVVGLDNAILSIRSLTPAILDGYEGKLIIHPTEETATFYRQLRGQKAKIQADLASLRDQSAITLDGRRITLSANIEFEYEMPLVHQSGAEGVGLYRTEFFLLDQEPPPDENHQAALYRRVVEAAAPHGVIFRTLDAGGDKHPGEPLSEPEPNPFLGWRGIRFSLDRRDHFKQQLRAILRASAYGKVGIMFPFVSGLREVRQALKVLDECREDLREAGLPFDPQMEVGAMIEVPSAALMSQEIAHEVDFLSIGTNDLIQYTVAVDRINPRVADLYKPAHPSVLRLIKTTVEGASHSKIWTGVCGEMAGNLLLLPVLIGLGVEELSVGTSLVPAVKQAIQKLTYQECQQLAQQVLAMPESRLITHACTLLAQRIYPELLN